VPGAWDTCKRCHAALIDRVPALAGHVAGPAPNPVPSAPAPMPAAAPAAAGPPPLPTLPQRVAPPLPPTTPPGGAYDASYNAPARLGGPIGPGGYVPPASFGADDGGAGSWAAPPLQPASASKPAWLKVLVVAIAIVVGFAGFRFVQARLNAPPAAVQDYIDGDGVTYAPAGGTYSIRFPQQPAVSTQTDPANGTTVELALIEEEQWEAVLAVAVLPQPIPPGDARALMQVAAAGGNSAISGEIDEQEATTHEGHPALDLEFEPPDGYPMHARIVVVGNRMFMVAAHAVHGTGAFFDELVESLHVSAV
jgi:hypothetical protein